MTDTSVEGASEDLTPCLTSPKLKFLVMVRLYFHYDSEPEALPFSLEYSLMTEMVKRKQKTFSSQNLKQSLATTISFGAHPGVSLVWR